MKKICAVLVVLIITLPAISMGNAESCCQGNMSCYEQSSMQALVSAMPLSETTTTLGGRVIERTAQSSLQNLEVVVQSSSQNYVAVIVDTYKENARPTEYSYYPASPVEKGDEGLSCIESEQCQELNGDMENKPEEGKCAISVEINSPVNTKRVASEEKEE